MKKLKYISVSAMLFLSMACTKDFEEINTNPNAPTQAQPDLLLRQVSYGFGDEMSFEGYSAGTLLSQQFTKIDFNLFDRHALLQGQNGGNPWPIYYTFLRDNELLLNQGLEGGTKTVYEGPARIIKAYLAMGLTDLFGDVPYFNAFKGSEGTTTPEFDKQEDIYMAEDGILDNLDKGIQALQNYNGATPLQGDVIYNGDLSAWVKFANSLKIKALMRISSKIDVSAQLQAIISNGNFIKINAENAAFDFTGSQPNAFRIANVRAGDFGNFLMSETMDSVLSELNDSRIGVLFRPTANNNAEFKGLRNGPDAASLSISVANFSLTGTIFRENTSTLDYGYITAWESNLLLAEAAERGFIAGSAQNYYNTGVQQAFDYWGASMPADYLNNGPAAYANNGANPIEQIITQKWIASTINGYEGWIEWRRTGFPEFLKVTASLNNGIIPVRLPYPQEESQLNGNNYNVAASATNGNSINTPVWWNE